MDACVRTMHVVDPVHSMLCMSPVHPLKGACPLSIQLSSEYIVLSTAFVEVHTIFRA